MSRHRELKKVSDLLQKYQDTLKPPQRSIEKAFVSVANEVCGISLTSDQVTYTVATKTLTLATPSVVKQELMINKEAILTKLSEQLGQQGKDLTII